MCHAACVVVAWDPAHPLAMTPEELAAVQVQSIELKSARGRLRALKANVPPPDGDEISRAEEVFQSKR